MSTLATAGPVAVGASFEAFGCQVEAASNDEAGLRQHFDNYDLLFSRFRPDSEINRVNARSGPRLLSAPFAAAVAASLAAFEQTDGLVDPTLGQAIVAAGYDRDFSELEPSGEPPAATACGRAQELRLTATLLFLPAGVQLDLNGVVKALAVDEGLKRFGGFLAAGGDLATETALDVALPADGAIRLEKGALATSGIAKRSWWRNGPQHHLIDPRSGRPSTSLWREVTVCAASCLGADVAAKAAFLLAGDGPDWLDQHGLAGRFVSRDSKVVVNGCWQGSL